ncbi:DUF551 domain-containing protein [Escherichia coli]|uniref:DUF551 domain-containing protein n=3 Tax=Escherichia coli TaxID=562 RepID=UPI000B80123D|nr:DUF551 domain-containing protein [Escherichia coli]EFA4349083.1 DUF551 domain-containing protein [Escherichia coli]EFA6127249.1 DUF551 domain-containing protein [Escherichia coli]EFC3434745.1 DUF551 domain-containing protein [Escherichia coli]EFC4770309.1 DUF551 domain-containing protein [Escherichia coli]
MTTITKERLLTIKQWRETYGPGSNVVLPAEEAEELARIALTSLEAEPVAYIFKHPAGKLFWALTDESNKEQADVIPVYAAAPASVVPDNASEPLAYAYKELTPEIMRNHLAVFERYGIAPNDSSTTIQALRIALDGIERSDAMLHGAEPVSQTYKLNELSGNSPVTPDGWISCSERMPVIGELNWRTSFPLLVTCEIGVIPAYYGFVSINGERHYGFMESLKYGDDSGNHPQTNEYDLISNVTHWMPLPEPPQEVNRG